MANPVWLPRHDEIRGARRVGEAAALLAALALLAWHGLRLATSPGPLWPWLPLALLAGAALADLASGLVHWLADSWGRESMPIVGRRLLRPFRIHHVNPADFLRRDLLDTNGDVAALVALVLAPALALPLDTASGRMAVAFVTAFGAAALPTNQVHQWAHMPRPPHAVAWLQARGLLLGRAAHAQHHRAPHTRNYCIALGWLNRPLAALDFFARLERAITRATGRVPRADDESFRAGVASERARAAGRAERRRAA